MPADSSNPLYHLKADLQADTISLGGSSKRETATSESNSSKRAKWQPASSTSITEFKKASLQDRYLKFRSQVQEKPIRHIKVRQGVENLSSEERVLLQINKLREEKAKRKEKNRQFYLRKQSGSTLHSSNNADSENSDSNLKRQKSGRNPSPIRKEVTRPKNFQLATAKESRRKRLDLDSLIALKREQKTVKEIVGSKRTFKQARIESKTTEQQNNADESDVN